MIDILDKSGIIERSSKGTNKLSNLTRTIQLVRKRCANNWVLKEMLK
jgi:hypothetical protein